MNKLTILFSIIAASSITFSAVADEHPAVISGGETEYGFDPMLFRGSRISPSAIERLSRPNTALPGIYKVDVYVNEHFITQRSVVFKEISAGMIQPCLTPELIQLAKIDASKEIMASMKKEDDCLLLDEIVKDGSSELDMAKLYLYLSIPQSQLLKKPRGYVDPGELDYGSTIGFINYITNYYHVSYSGGTARNMDSAWAAFNGGVNLGKWQFRQLSNFNWQSSGQSKWNITRSYMQRPLPSVNSQFLFGQLITTGNFFSGLAYDGISLSTDERMKPESVRGYAPVIRGIASTNAKVSVRQNGREIYQTTVSPGSFEINDLYPTSYSGDLDVTVTEATGEVSQFSVPFAAIPESMRAGMNRYNFALGKTRDSGAESPFSDFVWQQGVSNSITANSGVRIADGYQAVMFGGVYGGLPGALGLDLTWSHARLPDEGYTNGWMAHLAWSKTFQETNTTFTLAGYRYSTAGYRDLSDVLGVREAATSSNKWKSNTYQQQSRFDISLSQSLERYGNIYLSGSTQNYRNGRSRDTQLQLGYSNSFSRGVGMNLSLARQRLGGYSNNGKMQTMASLSFSIPLGTRDMRAPSLTTSWTNSSGEGSHYQTSVSGVMGENDTTSYNLNANYDQKYSSTVVGGSLQKRMALTTLGLNSSKGSGYWQVSGNADGALAIHSGGITAGPYLGDTFALVEAKGAAGAGIFNSQQLSVNDQGYALVPSMTPYRFNRITLDPNGMNDDAELVESEKNVAPVAGAGVKVVFRTRAGTAMLITSNLPDGLPVPLGADVMDEKGEVVGMVGQRGQIYVRSDKQKGKFTVKWGDDKSEQCSLPFDISKMSASSHLIKFASDCA